MTYLKTPFQGLTFKTMERHFNLTQAFIPLGGSPAVVAVAAPTILTDHETARDLELAYSGAGGWVLTQEVDFEAERGVTFRLVVR